MRIVLVLAISILSFGSAASAAPYYPGPLPTEFGPTFDDWVAGDPDFFRGERETRKNARILRKTLVNCYRVAVRKLVNGNLEAQVVSQLQACVASATAAYDAAQAGLSPDEVVPPCLDDAAFRSEVEDRAEDQNAVIYCQGSTSLPGSFGGGFLPPDSATQKGEAGIAIRSRTFRDAVERCYDKGARLVSQNKPSGVTECLFNPTNGVIARWNEKVASFSAGGNVNVPGCIDWPTLRDDLAAEVQADNAVIYCASPSGAFLDGAVTF
jgi:hypothetical protein